MRSRAINQTASCRFLATVLSGVLFALPACRQEGVRPLEIGAAISLREVLPVLIESWQVGDRGGPARVSYAASGTIARQVRGGAMFDVVVLADEQSLDLLCENGDMNPASRSIVARNSLVLVAAPDESDSAAGPDDPAARLRALAADARLVLGDPSYVPVGRYARAWLESVDLWEDLRDRLVFAADAAATLAYVERGEAELGIVYATDARRALVPVAGVLDAGPASPVVTAAVASQAAGPAAAFVDFLSGPSARAIFARFGFGPATS